MGRWGVTRCLPHHIHTSSGAGSRDIHSYHLGLSSPIRQMRGWQRSLQDPSLP